MDHRALIELLPESDEPYIRWKIAVNVLERERSSPEIVALEREIKESDRVKALLQHVDGSGLLQGERGIYDKWQGTHWVLLTLADIDYPRHDEALRPLAGKLLQTWLDKRFFNEFVVDKTGGCL